MNAHLPGQSVSVEDDEWGTKCNWHPEVVATHRICSESDSFGSEYANFCNDCWEERQLAIKAKEQDPEQWDSCRKCGENVPRLSSYRDPDEGMHGPVYEACPDCVSKFWKRYQEECELLDDDY